MDVVASKEYVRALKNFWWIPGYHREGRRSIELLLGCHLPPPRGRASFMAGQQVYGQGEYVASERYFAEALDLARQVGDAACGGWVGLGGIGAARYTARGIRAGDVLPGDVAASPESDEDEPGAEAGVRGADRGREPKVR